MYSYVTIGASYTLLKYYIILGGTCYKLNEPIIKGKIRRACLVNSSVYEVTNDNTAQQHKLCILYICHTLTQLFKQFLLGIWILLSHNLYTIDKYIIYT